MVKLIPKFIFLHVVFEGQRLQVAQLVEGEKVLDDISSVFDKTSPALQA